MQILIVCIFMFDFLFILEGSRLFCFFNDVKSQSSCLIAKVFIHLNSCNEVIICVIRIVLSYNLYSSFDFTFLAGYFHCVCKSIQGFCPLTKLSFVRIF